VAVAVVGRKSLSVLAAATLRRAAECRIVLPKVLSFSSFEIPVPIADADDDDGVLKQFGQSGGDEDEEEDPAAVAEGCVVETLLVVLLPSAIWRREATMNPRWVTNIRLI
jgi:hypothetical protein